MNVLHRIHIALTSGPRASEPPAREAAPLPVRGGGSGSYCSFCGKAAHEVAALIAGPPGAFICDECVEVCQRELHQAHRRLRAEASA